MGRAMSDLPGSLHEKVVRMSRFLCHSRFDVTEAFHQVARGIIESLAHSSAKQRILIALDWTDLGPFMGLWLSLPYQGRALPLSCAVLAKSASEFPMLEAHFSKLTDRNVKGGPNGACVRHRNRTTMPASGRGQGSDFRPGMDLSSMSGRFPSAGCLPEWIFPILLPTDVVEVVTCCC
jgi:hypothetical protein